MRLHRLTTLSLLSILGLAVGCSSGASSTSQGPGEPPAEHVPDPPVAPPAAPANTEWEHKIERASFDAMARSDAGDLFVAGDLLSGPTDFGGGPMTATDAAPLFVAKYGADGAFKWVKTFPSVTKDLGKWSLAADASGGVHVLVGVSGSIDFGGGAIASSSTEAGKPSLVYAHLDASGAHVASRLFLGCFSGCGQGYVARGSSGTYFTAESEGDVELGDTIYTGGGSFEIAGDESGAATYHGPIYSTHVLGAAIGPEGQHVALATDGVKYTSFLVSDPAQKIIGQGTVDTGIGDPNAFSLRAPLDGANIGVYVAGTFPGTIPGRGTGLLSVDVPPDPKLPRIAWYAPIEESSLDDFLQFSAASTGKDDYVIVGSTFAGKVLVGGPSGTPFTSGEGAGEKEKTDILLLTFAFTGELVAHKTIGGPGRDAIKAIHAIDLSHAIIAGDAAIGKGYLAAVTLDVIKVK